jgi:hypothetical protein
MRLIRRVIITSAVIVMLGGLFLTVSKSSAQNGRKLPKSIMIQAQAMGTNQQMGRSFSVNIYIDEFSTPEDQKALLEAFSQSKNEGLVNALSKMKSKGRMAITGTLGYDVNYIREFKMPDGGTKYRLVTDRPIRFGEAWSDSRSMDYSLSGAEIILSADGKKNSGTLLPAAQFKLDKENHLEIELFQNEWKLVNIRKR